MTFFENVPRYGDLELEKTLFMFDNIPIVFVCRDYKKNYYLCQCIDVITGFSWMITRISRAVLVSMMKDEISILKAFETSGHDIIFANKEKKGMKYKEVSFEKISPEELPDPDEKLENPNLQEYICKVQRESYVNKITYVFHLESEGNKRQMKHFEKLEAAIDPKAYRERVSVDNIACDKMEDEKCFLENKVEDRNILKYCLKKSSDSIKNVDLSRGGFNNTPKGIKRMTICGV